jgi:hypothetical protein
MRFNGGLQLENPTGRLVTVGRAQFAAGAVAIGVHSADTDIQLSRDLFGCEMAIDKRKNLSFALGQKPKLIWPLRRIRTIAHRLGPACLSLTAPAQVRAAASAVIRRRQYCVNHLKNAIVRSQNAT